ncbi:hypothetical protein PVK06_034668 [Gossypium arboreum]|uniref:RNase H type-1 domain-containing protein n=1 Tax=Gossypium arboreum TaxID=29729 RepID=A0ABR0NHV7_GOSAR|nr:hypothetical protein PVK06_034668 [Gossypium arboreum]
MVSPVDQPRVGAPVVSVPSAQHVPRSVSGPAISPPSGHFLSESPGSSYFKPDTSPSPGNVSLSTHFASRSTSSPLPILFPVPSSKISSSNSLINCHPMQTRSQEDGGMLRNENGYGAVSNGAVGLNLPDMVSSIIGQDGTWNLSVCRLGLPDSVKQAIEAVLLQYFVNGDTWDFCYCCSGCGFTMESMEHILCEYRFAKEIRVAMRVETLQLDFYTTPFLVWLEAWKRLPLEYCILNTDSAMRTGRQLAIAGGLLRNERGEWLHGFMSKIGVTDNLQVELWVVREGFRTAKGLDVTSLILKLDVLWVLNLLSRPLDIFIEDCLLLIQKGHGGGLCFLIGIAEQFANVFAC